MKRSKDFITRMRSVLAVVMMSALLGCGSIEGCNALVPTTALSGGKTKSVVVLVDLTPSAASMRERYKEGVRKIIDQLEAADQIEAYGITGNSFNKPMELLYGPLPQESGQLNIQLIEARKKLRELWDEKAKVTVNSAKSDILGGIDYAALLLRQKSGSKWLIVFSDGRQNTSALDLESPADIRADQAIVHLQTKNLISDLTGVNLVFLGVHTGGNKSMAYLKNLEAFWKRYAAESHAVFCAYRYDVNWQPFTQETN